MAVYNGKASAVAALLNFKQPFDEETFPELLGDAASQGHYPVVSLLIKAGANINRKTYGKTPLYMAASNGRIEALETLLFDCGADPSLTDNEGRSPLWMAAEKGHIKVIEALLEGGAKADQKDNFGVSPLDVAIARKHEKIVALLSKA